MWMSQRSGNMQSFIFNNYKKKLLSGRLSQDDVWSFYLVNKQFGEDLEEVLPSITDIDALQAFIYSTDATIAKKDSALDKYTQPYTPVRYTYKVADKTVNSERPSYVDLDNWEEFNKKYPKQVHLYHFFFVPGGALYREYESDELDYAGNKVMKPRGFYYVETTEELKWCAEKVNGIVNGNKSEVYNNKINIVLGDNIGYGKALENEYKEIDFSIGSDIDRPFEGIFYGNGYIIQNIELVCKGNSTGLIGYLGTSGLIHTIRVAGHNLIRCGKKLNITHMMQDASDINAGFLCGKNNGTISDVTFTGKVTFADFVPGVYTVSNKTDEDGNAFDNPDVNTYYPDYLCINSIANIVPYIGYFNEGVFGTWAYSAGPSLYPTNQFSVSNKGFWKSNAVYAGDISVGTISNYYPYDNRGCGEWAYPKAVDNANDIYESVTGHTLFYSINTMFDTNMLAAGKQTDWSTYLSLLKYTYSANPTTMHSIWNWEIQSTQYLDKPLKMHQFNRVAYNTGLLIGCNEGSVYNIAMNATAYTSGTYVGFLGGIAGKQAVNGNYGFNNVCVNLTAADVIDDKRDYYISDDGDTVRVEDTNPENIVEFVTDLLASEPNYSVLNNPLYGTKSLYNSDEYRKKLNIGGTNSDGTFDWGDTSLIRLNINGYSGMTSGTLNHEFDIAQSAFDGICYHYNGFGYEMPAPPYIEPHQKFANAWILRNTILTNSAYSGSLTAINTVEPYSGMHVEDSAEIALSNYEIFDKRTGGTYGFNHSKSLGIIYNYGRYGHEGSLTNDIKDPYSKDTDGNALSNDDKIQVRDANLVAGPEGYAFTTYTDFATYSIDKWYNSWGIRDSVKLAFDHFGSNGFAKDEFYIYNCAIGNLVLKKRDTELRLPNTFERTMYNVAGIYGTNNYTYDTYDIVGATNVVLSIYIKNVVAKTVSYYTLTIPEILNSDQSIGGTKFTNKASKEFFIANYENPNANKPVVSFLKERYVIDGCKNYKIELKSIKNIGALFGSLVLGTNSTMTNVSAYLNNQHTTCFESFANHKCIEGGLISDLGTVVNISAFDVSAASASNNFFNDENLKKICTGRNGYFMTSSNPGQPEVYVKYKTLSGINYGYWSDVDGFKLSGGMTVGLFGNSLMYAFSPFAHPELHDYSFDNRFAPFAAVCEYNSSNISDKYIKSTAAVQHYIAMNNINCVYTESNNYSDTQAGPYRHYGPMILANNDWQFSRDKAFNAYMNTIIPTYAFGIALPFIAEIKPTYMAIPSINQSPLSNIDTYGDYTPSAAYKRLGMFTMDQIVAAPTNDPNYWSINLNVDLPGFVGIIDRTENKNTQVMKAFGFEINNEDSSFERGKTTGNLLDHLFNMDQVKINKLYYGYISPETNEIVPGEGYGRMLHNYAEVADTMRLGMDPQSANDIDPDISVYTQNKVLAPDMYFGSDLVLNSYVPYASGYYGDPGAMTIIGNNYNPFSIGEYHQYFSPVTTSAVTNNVLATEPFKYNKTVNIINSIKDLVTDKDYGWLWSGIMGNIIKANAADAYTGTDMFKYNFVKEVLTSARKFTLPVKLEENANKYGFWFSDSVSALSYDKKNCKYYNGDNDEIRYDGSLLHLGATFSEKSILDSLKTERIISAASGIICEDFDGLLVVDKHKNNVMYIDVGLGECDGTQSWSMTCSAEGVNGKGLIMEIE